MASNTISELLRATSSSLLLVYSIWSRRSWLSGLAQTLVKKAHSWPSAEERRPLSEDPGLVRYREFLIARDGEADLFRHRFSKCEEFFDSLARSPVFSYANVDRAAYFRNMARRRHETNLEPRMLWLLATAKANQAERFGVGLAKLLGRVKEDDPACVHVVLQESYYTRILADVV